MSQKENGAVDPAPPPDEQCPESEPTDLKFTTNQNGARWRVSRISRVNAEIRPIKDFDPSKIIESIRADKQLQAKTEKIRFRFSAVNAKEGYKAAKKAIGKAKVSLPAVLWSGTFENANAPVADKLIQHSGLLCADLDKPELDEAGKDINTVRAELLDSLHLWAVFLSPTGHGLKAVFRVRADATKHEASWRAMEKHVRELTGVQIDESCKDVGRLCFFEP